MPRVNKGRMGGAGRTSVTYRDAKGHTFDAVVTGGTFPATVDLFLPSYPTSATAIKTGIAKRTTRAATNVWW